MTSQPNHLSNTYLDQYFGQYQLQKKDNTVHIFGLYYEYGEGQYAMFRLVWGRQNAKQLQNKSVSFSEGWRMMQKHTNLGYKIVDKSTIYWADYQKNKLLNALENSTDQTKTTKEEKDLVKKRRFM